MKHKRILTAILILSLICIVLSIIILSEKNQYAQHQTTFCSALTGTNGCEVVQTSNYSQILGVSNPIYGIIGFTLLCILSLYMLTATKNHRLYYFSKYATIAGGIIAGLVAISFIYIQTFILHTYCLFCVFVDISSIALLVMSIYLLFQK